MATSDQIHAAYQAAKAGDRLRARQILRAVLESEPENERAWFLYAKVAESRDRSIASLEKVLEINQFNTVASRDLERLRARQSDRTLYSTAKHKLPAWVWLSGAVLIGLLMFGCVGFLLNSNWLFQDVPLAVTVAVSPVVQPTPTSDCDCTQAIKYLDNTIARYEIIASQIDSIETAIDANRLAQVDFFAYSAQAKSLYKEQLSEAPPPCLHAFQTKTVSLLWNWQQSMQYAASGQYDAVDIFLQGFIDEFTALESEGQKLEKKLQGCIQDPSLRPSL